MAMIRVVKARNQAIAAGGKRIRHGDVVGRVKDEARRPSLISAYAPLQGDRRADLFPCHLHLPDVQTYSAECRVLLQAKSVE